MSLKDLILAQPSKAVENVMREDVIYVNAAADVETVAKDLARYDLIAMPVVDQEGRLIGIITHDDVIDVVIEEATQDAHMMGAVQPLAAEYLESPFWDTVRKRVVWLRLLFFSEMSTEKVLHVFNWLAEFALLVGFMPVIMATGGNSGSQAASLITRSLALGEVGPKDWFRVARRELLSGIVLGAAIGLLAICYVLINHNDHSMLALVLVLALVAVTTSGSLVGSLLPLIFKKVGLDPAISSGPFVSSLVDVVGIFMYFSIAALVLYRFH